MTDFDLMPECPTCRGQGRIQEGERPLLPPLSTGGVHPRPAGLALTSSLELVGERFPLLRERVASLLESDLIFRELCEDYEACALALDRHVSGDALRREYAALQLHLETELLRYVNDADERSARKN